MASTSSLATTVIFLSLLGPTSGYAAAAGQRRRRAFLVFGDSLVDNGNNNYLVTSARADCPPYGIDYPTGKPTGRFSNGLNIPDIIAEKMGLATVLPFLSPELRGFKLLDGANFASAGVGVLNDTGIQFVEIIRIWCQLDNFELYQHRVAQMIGRRRTRKLVNEAVFLITCGGNDFVNNYFVTPYSERSLEFSLPDYVRYVISEYRKVLRRLYELGARTVLVPGPGPMGCAPAELATHSRNGECYEELQQASEMFNEQIREMGRDLNRELGKDVFITANTNLMHLDLFIQPEKFGFISGSEACCGQGPYNGIGICTPFSKVCEDRNLHLFWDAYHPSEKATRLLVEQIFVGSEAYMHPMNLSSHMAAYSRASWRR